MRRVSGVGKDIQNLANPMGFRISEVKTASVSIWFVRNMIDSAGYKINRNNIQLATFEANQGHPGRECVTGLL